MKSTEWSFRHETTFEIIFNKQQIIPEQEVWIDNAGEITSVNN